ncbi:AGAP000754-PA [Anopheles gambiae str. PEST]|uniref:AGAP000754-PA n=1 Tax=Anopheles gambiae TaxID=7165 RepID=Q7QEA2_ANOGA|nr:AGAP000754-PA [Anopheles gambiae str. PEST]
MRNNVKRRRASSGGGGLTTQTLLDFDLGESSSDSDFRIEDHDESDDCSLGSKDDGDDDGDDDDDDEDEDDDDDDESGDDSGDDSEDNGEAGAGSNPLLQLLHGAQNGGGNEEEEDESTTEGGGGQAKGRPPVPAAKQTSERDAALQKLLMKSICCACLGDRSDDQNEIVECDGCGVTVHEGCYGVSECTSVTSTISSCSTEPWFCDACKAGVENPDCELCPNKGGIFKETDVGRWVHLVCALYVPGVAFGEVDQLSSVTLFEMPYNKWGAKTCCLCEDAQLARTGVCIGCDAGMCKTYFHVTCAQYYGLLSEAHSEEADQADPFYAHCKIHSDKSLIKHRKRNYNTIRMRAVQRQVEEEGRRQQKPTAEQVRIERKLTKHRRRYVANKETKNPPWVPTQKMPRLLITSATACKKLLYKAELMGLDRAAIEFQEAQVASLADVRKKWHIPPAFSVEFIGYYLDRALRLEDMKKNLQEQMALNQRLLGKQQHLRNRYDQAVAQSQAAQKANDAVRASIARLYEHIGALCPSKALVPVEQIGKPPAPVPAAMTAPPPPPPPPPIAQPAQPPAPPPEAATAAASAPPAPPPPYVKPHQSVVINTGPLGATPPARTMSVPTAAALKMGVGFPLQNLMVPGKRDDTGRILSTQCKQNSEELLNECGICKRCHDQHLLAKCDTCHLHYHLGCLNPPLTRHPKKSKLYGWQCSECDQSDDSNPESIIIPKAPRKSRTRYSKDGTIVPYDYAFPPDTQPQAVEAVGRRASRAGPVAVEVKDETVAESTNEAVDPLPVKTPGKRGRKKKSLEGVAVGETTTAAAAAAITAATNLATAVQSKEVKQQKKKSDPKLPDGKDAADEELGEEEEEEARQSDEHSGKHSLLNTTPSELDTSDEQRASEGGSSKMAKVESTTHHHHHHHHQHHHPGPPHAPTAGSSEATAAHTNAQLPAPEGSSEALAADGGGDGGREPPGAMGGLPASVEDGAATSTHHKHSKRRKEKHRNRSPNADRPISKDHKRKRKRKNHDYETVDQTELVEYPLPEYGDSRPRIKIKIKSVLDGSNTHTTQIYYVRTEPQEEEPAEPQLTSGAADSSSQAGPLMSHPLLPQLQPAAQFNGSTEQTITITQGRARVKRDVGSRHNASSTTSIGSSVGSSGSDECICDVCQGVGTSANIVQCDECQKSYHFGCLEPPLKKTPKRRGYSWHCADCDPTDVEN